MAIWMDHCWCWSSRKVEGVMLRIDLESGFCVGLFLVVLFCLGVRTWELGVLEMWNVNRALKECEALAMGSVIRVTLIWNPDWRTGEL